MRQPGLGLVDVPRKSGGPIGFRRSFRIGDYRVDDRGVTGTSANVAGERIADVVARRTWVAHQQSGGRDQNPGRTGSAWRHASRDERLPNRAERGLRCQSFPCHDFCAFAKRRQRKASQDRRSVDQNGAGPTGATRHPIALPVTASLSPSASASMISAAMSIPLLRPLIFNVMCRSSVTTAVELVERIVFRAGSACRLFENVPHQNANKVALNGIDVFLRDREFVSRNHARLLKASGIWRGSPQPLLCAGACNGRPRASADGKRSLDNGLAGRIQRHIGSDVDGRAVPGMPAWNVNFAERAAGIR